ncbi:hypothetical protein [Succinimonas sp.]|uniref:hypothetical protein n=1 Tax=Succinimonas sp. TaxID=1936151 RepID=UPI00386EE8C7
MRYGFFWESLPLSKCIPGQVYVCRYSVREKSRTHDNYCRYEHIFSGNMCDIRIWCPGEGYEPKKTRGRKRGEENAGMIAGKMMAVIHTVIAAGNDEMTAHKEARFA